MNVENIPIEQTVEITRDIARTWVNDLPETMGLDALATAIDYAQGEFDKADGCKYVLIKVVA